MEANKNIKGMNHKFSKSTKAFTSQSNIGSSGKGDAMEDYSQTNLFVQKGQSTQLSGNGSLLLPSIGLTITGTKETKPPAILTDVGKSSDSVANTSCRKGKVKNKDDVNLNTSTSDTNPPTDVNAKGKVKNKDDVNFNTSTSDTNPFTNVIQRQRMRKDNVNPYLTLPILLIFVPLNFCCKVMTVSIV